MKNKLLLLFLLLAFAIEVVTFYLEGGITFVLYSVAVSILLFVFMTIILKKYEDKTKPLLIVFLLALAIEIITAPLRAIDGSICAVVTFVLFFIFMVIILKKYDSKTKRIYILLAALLGCSFIPLPIHIIHWKSTLGTLPDYLFHMFGILMGYWFYIGKKWLKYIIVIFSVMSCIFLYFWGYDMFINKYLNHQTFTGVVKPEIVDNISFQTKDGDIVTLENFKGKYLFVDCWYTYCGICYREFPNVQALAEEYKNNQNIEFIALHSRLEKEGETFAKGDSIFAKREISLPCFSINYGNENLKTLQVFAYPTILIFDKESKLIFRGDIKFAKMYLKKRLK